jgi:hypothetical protein
MLITGVLCLCAAAVSAAFGLWTLARPRAGGLNQQILLAVAPTQLAAAVMLVAGGVVALARPPHTGLLVVIVCILGAVGTVAAGSWQGARFAARQEAPAECAGSCAACTLSCH